MRASRRLRRLSAMVLVIVGGVATTVATSEPCSATDPSCQPPTTVVIVTTSLPSAFVGVPYSTTLSAEGGNGSYAWRLVSGALPEGVSLTPNGSLTGTPAATGVQEFTVEATSGALSATRLLSLSVVAPPP